MLKLSKLELDIEEWRLVPGTGNMYVSNMGRVKKIYKKSEKILKPYTKKGVPPLWIKVNGKELKLATVVYMVFMGDYDGSKYGVVHKNLKNDDRLVNLVLMTKQEIGRRTGGKTRKARGIYKCDKKNKILYDHYRSSREAARENYCSYQTILDSCNGATKSNCTGFDFVWANIVDNEVPGRRKAGWKPWTWEEEE